jgi:glycosidase/PKD repeat protein
VKKPTDPIPDPDPEDPTIAATFTTSVSKLVVSFASNVSYTGDKSVTYSWDFGDGQTSTDAKPTHTYPQDGTYTVVLTVTDGTISNTYTKTVAVASDVTPSQPEIEATFTSSADNLKVSFEPKVNFTGEGTVKYSWDFGDGKKSTDEKPSHTYSKAGSYTVTLTVSAGDLKDVYTSEVTVTAGAEDPKPEVCPENDPYCKGEIDPAECQQTCETKEIEVCDDATTSSVKALSPSVSAVSAPIATTYYATNPNGQVGVEKTITSMSDWTSDMIIAQGAANDDPRAFRGYHEMATDFYALYAAYDDTNLYLMIEMPSLPMGFGGDSRVPEVGSDFDYSTSQFLPMGIGIRTGVRTAGTGLLDEGYNVWTKANVYTIEEGIDTLLMFHPNLKAGDPGLFKTNSDGLFTYTRTEGLLLGFKEAGIERVVEHTAKSANYWGLPDNYGKDATFYTAESDYQNLLKGDASGHLYQITIPLASIDITKDHIKNNGIAVMTFSTFGESMMDALPWTPNLVDKASEAYSKDDSTSAEKEDVDVYDVPLARIGKTELEPPIIVPPVEDNCRKETVTVCTPEVLPDSCSSTGSISVELTHVETSTDKQVETTVTVATGYKGVKYEWEVTGKEKVTTSYDETTKKFTFKKGTTAKDVTITVTAKNASGKKTGSKSFDLTIPACEGDACGTVVNGEWFSAQGVDTDNIKKYDTSNTCKAADGAVILKADVSSAPNAYIYKDETSITAAWPGDALTKVEGCTSTFYQSKSGILSSTVQVIFNEVGGDRYPADMQPGVEMSAAASCFDWASKKAVSAEDCGLVSAPPTDTAYILRNGKEVADGSTITITYKEDDPSTGYVDVSLMVYGTDTDESSEGTFTVDGQEATFVNGQILRIGENIEAAEDKASATPMTLVVKYGNDTKTYKFIKVKWTKPTATTQFTWNNALIYFVMTDRFYNADKTNDNNFGRTYKDATGHSTATFHGGDIKGMTERLDYIKSLGMNAIWITAPYEQAHGWTGGGKTGVFAHWGYHGYYALDFTSMDPNVGTVEEFRTFVKEAHKKGLRVILDIVMNHSGYATLRDMCDFSFGKTKDGWDYCTEWTPSGGKTWHDKPIDETVDSSWNGWWGKDWLRFGGYGGCGGDDLTTCTSYLPDFKNEANGPTVGIPAFLQKKWASSKAEYDIPAAKAYRSGNMSVADSIAHWLASWVEEFGIDGFRCDTAKHVQKETWGKLHKYSQEALQKWRSENAGGDDPAASWTQDFFMTGEHWGFGKDASDNDGYARVGGFTSMINFSLGCSTPGAGQWKEYASTYNNGTGAPKLNALTYVSSHDTALCRPSDMKALGTGLLLLPGGVQVYYGDETARPNDHGGSGNDEEHGTRSDMNFPSDIASQSEWAAGVDTLSTSFSSNETLAHWQKIGQFRYRNAAVGAGKQTETGDGSYCRTYANETEGINNSVVIHVGSASSVDVGSCFEDGTELQDAYSGATGTVSGGKVSLSGTGSVILLELKR